MARPLPALLRPLHSDEYLPVAPHPALAAATDAVARRVPDVARRLRLDASTYVHDRRATALALRAIDAAHGGGFYAVGEDARHDPAAAAEAFRAHGPVVDVQTHLVDPTLWHGPHAAALGHFLRMVDPERWPDAVDPHAIDAAAWAALVFGASETAVALLTSTPGPAGENVLENAQIAAVRDVTDRYGGTGRVLTHTIVHPNLGPAELDRMGEWSRALRPSAWKVYTLAGPPTAASPTGGWFLDDDEIGTPFLERVRCARPAHRVRAQGPRRTGARRLGGGRVAARRRSRRGRVRRHRLRRVPLRLRAGPARCRGQRSTRSRRVAWTGSSRRPARTASGPAATSRPSSAAPGSSSCAGRWRPPTCSASSSRSSVPSGSSGAPTAPGTDRRSR